MRKKTLHTLFAGTAASMMLFAACTKKGDGFLDKTDTGTINEEKTFADSALTMQFLNGIYRNLSYTYFIDNGLFGGGLWSFSDATDDSEIRWGGAVAQTAQAYNSSTFSGVAEFARMRNDHWNTPYTNIRRVNIFLGNVDKGPLSEGRKQLAKAEARFLRAYYYFDLVRMFGNVPLITEPLEPGNYNIPQANPEDVYKLIAEDLKIAATDLSDRKYADTSPGGTGPRNTLGGKGPAGPGIPVLHRLLQQTGHRRCVHETGCHRGD